MAETTIERLKKLRTEALEELRRELTDEERKSVDGNHLQEIMRVIEADKLVLVSGETEIHISSSVSQRHAEIMATLIKEALKEHFSVKIADPVKKDGLSEGIYSRRGVYGKTLIITGW